MRWIVLHQLDVRQLRQPDLHRAWNSSIIFGLLLRVGDVHLVDDLVERLVLPAGEVDQVRAGHRDAATLVEAQRRVRLVDRAAMAVDRADVLALLEAVVEVGRHAHRRLDAAALQHLRQHRADRRSRRAEADDVQREPLALRVGPEPLAVLLESLARQAARRPSSDRTPACCTSPAGPSPRRSTACSGGYAGIGSDDTCAAPR